MTLERTIIVTPASCLISLQAAIDDLLAREVQDSGRLNALAGYIAGRTDRQSWIDFFSQAVGAIDAIRKAPLWNQGLLEGAWIIRIDSRLEQGNRVVDLDRAVDAGQVFIESLIAELKLREPAIFQED